MHVDRTWEENSVFAVDRGNQMLFESVSEGTNNSDVNKVNDGLVL